jgi:hypothetical protein
MGPIRFVQTILAASVYAMIAGASGAQAQQPGGAVTLFNNVRVFDGKGTVLSEHQHCCIAKGGSQTSAVRPEAR